MHYTHECQVSTTPLVKTEHFVKYMPRESQLNNMIMLMMSYIVWSYAFLSDKLWPVIILPDVQII